MGKYLDIARKFEMRQQAERTEATPPTSPKPVFHTDASEEFVAEGSTWLCPHCGRLATIEDVFPSLDGERTLTMWRCDPCQTVAVTPNTIKEPPSGWVKRTEQ